MSYTYGYGLTGDAADTDPNVAYTWSYGLSGSAATYARLEKITLPGGRQVYYNYEDANAFMSLGRVANIAANDSPDDANTYVAYKYLGASTVVDANHPAVPNGLKLSYGSSANKYPGFDRFGRVVWQSWLRSSGTTAGDRYFYGYDRAGNRRWRAERWNTSAPSGRDEAYVYDGLDRLVGAKRGILPYQPYQAPYPGDTDLDGDVDNADLGAVSGNFGKTGMTWVDGDFDGDGDVDNADIGNAAGNFNTSGHTEDVAKSWSWGLSPTGNWETSAIDGNSQTRTHNNANEIATISGVTFAPLYDEAGSNVRGPRPADPNANNAAHFRYDAWNRLASVRLDDGGTPGTLDGTDTLLATYRYDGLNRRVKKVSAVDGNSVTDYMYHNEGWQVVEVRRGVDGNEPTSAAYKQYAWDLRYIDAPVCRWWDADSDGQMEPAAGEMQYFTNDGNFNTTALIDANSGQVVERYQYDPYGRPTVLNGATGAEKDPNVSEWTPDADNKSDWDNDVLYCGYQYDPVTGLCHVRNRYLNWLTGRWMTTDPAGYVDGVSLYEYVRSGPCTARDPSGLEDYAPPTARPGPMGPQDTFGRVYTPDGRVIFMPHVRPFSDEVVAEIERVRREAEQAIAAQREQAEKDRLAYSAWMKAKVKAILIAERDRHKNSVYYAPSGMDKVFQQLIGRGFAHVEHFNPTSDPKYAGYGYASETMTLGSAAIDTPLIVIHETTHALDDSYGWYADDRDREALAYTTQFLVQAAGLLKQMVDDSKWEDRSIQAYQIRWDNAWTEIDKISSAHSVQYGWSKDPLKDSDLDMVKEKLGFSLSCSKLKPMYEKWIDSKNPSTRPNEAGKSPTRASSSCVLKCPQMKLERLR